jgi:5-methylcytosine-specific restriction protein A
VKVLDPWKARGLKMVDDLPRKPLQMADIRTKRWTKKDNGRLLPLNSEAWYRLRRSVLAEQPLCQYCPPVSSRPPLRWTTRTTTQRTTAGRTW